MRSVNVARKARLAVACLLGATALTPFGAAGQTWQGGTGTEFNTGANWVGGTPPGGGTGAATFGNTANTTVTVTTGADIGSLTYSAGATAYTTTITNTTFETGTTNNNSGVIQTIAVNATTTGASFTTFGGNYAKIAFTATGGTGNLARVNFYGGDLNNAVLTANDRGNFDIRSNTTGGSGTRLVANTGGTISLLGLAVPSFTAGSIEGAGDIDLYNATLIVGSSNLSTVFSGRISRSGGGLAGLTKEGTGTLTLTGTNDFTGATTISAGTLQLGNGGTMGTLTSTSVVNNATLAFNHSNNTSFGSEISGTGAVTKAGAGNLTLSAANSYQGGTTINAGTLSVAANNNLGDASGTLTFGGGTLQTTASFITSRATTLNSGGGTFDVAMTLRQDAVIDGAGGLTKSGAGTLVLNGSNTYQGGTTINAGTITVVANDNLGNAAGTLTFGGGTLRTLSTFTMSRATTLNAGGGTFDVASGTTLTLDGVISGSGRLTLASSGTLTLTGANDYQGGTMIALGTLSVSANNNLGAANGILILSIGGTLRTTQDVAMSRTTSLFSGGGIFDVAALSTLDHNGMINGIGGLTKVGGGTLVAGRRQHLPGWHDDQRRHDLDCSERQPG